MRVEEKAACTLKAATAGRYINSLQPTGWSLLLIENLSHDAVDFRQVNSGVRFVQQREATASYTGH
jgi:hypothetical protein